MRNLAGLAKRWPKQTMEQRFWSKVEKTATCWLYKGHRLPSGYGQFQVQIRCCEYAHRMAYCFTKGSIPKRLHVLHTCDVRNCVNPKHLWLGTHQENMADMVAKGRHRKVLA